MIKQKYSKFLFILFLLILIPSHSNAQPSAGSEYRIKAGFIYHFARFTQWPSQNKGSNEKTPFIICIASTYPESNSLFSLQKKVLRGRRLIVKKYDSKTDIETCHILFIASDDKNFIAEKLEDAKDYKILTIGEEKEFAKIGGIINFFIEDERLRFAVNLKAARRANLKFSAQMLMSAEIVQEGP